MSVAVPILLLAFGIAAQAATEPPRPPQSSTDASSNWTVPAADPATPLVGLEEIAFKQAAAVVGPSVVRIQTVGGLDRVGQVLTGTGPTSGVVVSGDGYIISSSFNFAAKPSSILVELPDGRRLPAEIVSSDTSKMLTLLKIDAQDLPVPRTAPRNGIRVGQWALALGRTYGGTEPSISVGIVSALDRVWGKAIQTDAKISPVNYGGPLIDIEGRVLGILVPLSPRASGETAGVEWYDSGIGFAIPMSDIENGLDRLKSGHDLEPGLLGVELKGKGLLAGVPIIDRVRVNSPAEKAGLKPGDVIVEADGKPVDRQAELRHVLGRKYAGDTVALKVRRGKELLTPAITLVDELVAYESGFLGILPFRESRSGAPTAIGPAAEPSEIPAADVATGVRVRYVFAESPAEKAGLETRDRIVRVGDEAVADAAALLDEVGRRRPGEKVTLVWMREGAEKSAEVELVSIPEAIPSDLRSAAIPNAVRPAPAIPGPVAPGAAPAAAPPVPAGVEAEDVDEEDEDTVEEKAEAKLAAPRTGRFTREMPAHERSYWAYVPDGYNPDYGYGLMVWLHPGGDTMEAAIIEKWKPICDRRGIMIVAPKAEAIAGWTANEAEFVKDAVEEFVEEYPIDRSRIFLHTFSDGGDLGWNVVFKYRELFRGAAAVASPLKTKLLESRPDFRLQFYLACGEKDDLLRSVRQSAANLRKLKYPVHMTTLEGRDHTYPPQETIEEIGRWADCLDRI